MQANAADELHVERNHFPFDRVVADDDFLSAQAAAGVFHHGERLRQDFVEELLFDFKRLASLVFALVTAGLGHQFIVTVLFAAFFDSRLELGGFLPQFVVRKLLQTGLDLINLVNERPEFSHFAVILRPKNPFQKIHGKPK
jgi:hypothetical protein